MDIASVIDRFCIVSLKRDRITEESFKREYQMYRDEFDRYTLRDRDIITHFVNKLGAVHEQIWDVESSIRQAQEDALGLEEVGRRALKVRDLNRERQRIKNEIIDYFGEGHKDCKCNTNYAGGN